MKKVLVVDWLDKYGGAERVISSLSKVFDFSKCYTLTNIMTDENLKKVLYYKDVPVQPTSLRHFHKNFRYLFFLFPKVMKGIKIDKDTQVIISSSHAVAKSIQKSKDDQLHISYFQARNLKYVWDDFELYFGKWKHLFRPLIGSMRKRDVRDAQNPDYIIANSQFVQNWVKKTYQRESTVIYPPVDLSNFRLQTEKEDYYVAVGRVEPYKRFDLVIDAFNKTQKRLILIGDGSQLNELKKRANQNIEFTGFLEAENVFRHISRAKGFVHAGIEDFGIAPIEAQACGTPVIAYGFGGVLETIIENETGVFFREHSSDNLLAAIEAFESIPFDYQKVRENAKRFDSSNFENQINTFVTQKIKEKGM